MPAVSGPVTVLQLLPPTKFTTPVGSREEQMAQVIRTAGSPLVYRLSGLGPGASSLHIRHLRRLDTPRAIERIYTK
ncbi:hypothetical protein NDU88_002726 [Pleurodeles waltl]|uniref:Uncharacterized protein n=1 Tax=Pleurodeles waltl TaxID=8319 RepID=A0AAV7WR03_PLEWA|nr:hypothetical protein NDU88_002726 [Pleurodeles waltl]